MKGQTSTAKYIMQGVVALFIFGALGATTFTSLASVNSSATIIAVILGVEVVFCVGVMYKIAEGAGMV